MIPTIDELREAWSDRTCLDSGKPGPIVRAWTPAYRMWTVPPSVHSTSGSSPY